MRNAIYAEICRCVGFFFLMLAIFGLANLFAPFKIVPPILLLIFIIVVVLCGIFEYLFDRAAQNQNKLSFREQTLTKIKKGRVFF